jgi:hypothetical protein
MMFAGICSAQMWRPDHVVIVIEENHAYSQIVGASAAPYINSLLSDTLCALLTQSYGLAHPSQPNYIMLFSGANQGITTDNLPGTFPFTSTSSLGSELISAGFTFTGYSEDLPSVGSNVTTSGNYARKHNPWVNWQGSSTYPIPTNSNQPLSAFPSDYTTLPNVSFVIPNLVDDMHNGTDPSTITAGDTWLNTHLNGYIQWAKTHNSLFIFTFDEDNSASGNQILTFFIGAKVKKGSYSQTNNHYNILRMIEDMYSIPYLGGSSSALTIDYTFKNVLPVELTSFTAFASNNSVNLKWSTATELNNSGFDIERSLDKSGWTNLAFIKGNGNSNSIKKYFYTDNSITFPGKYYYRLKQVDNNGNYKYSDLIMADIKDPQTFSLNQNYPNPFNPSTIISYQLPVEIRTVLKVYNVLGKEVATLVNEVQSSGQHSVNFNASNYASGIYFYKIEAGPFFQVKKMILIK